MSCQTTTAIITTRITKQTAATNHHHIFRLLLCKQNGTWQDENELRIHKKKKINK
jgi:hypothetical protein